MDQPVKPPVPRKRAIPIAMTACVVLVLIVVLEPTQVVMGMLSGEAFFGGRPTRYWSHALNAGPAARADAEEKLRQGKGAAVPVLAEIVQSPSTPKTAEPRLLAADILAKAGPDAGAAASAFAKGLRDSDPHLQAICAAGLSKIGVPAETAVPLLTDLLKSQHAVVAARALSEYKGAAAPALPELVELLKDTDQPTEVRWNAARTIGKIGPAALSALPPLLVSINDAESNVREHSAEAIGDIGPTAAEGIPALESALTDVNDKVRRDALRSLGYLGPVAKSTVPAIMALLKDPVQRVKDAIVPALKSISPADAAIVEKQFAAEKAEREKEAKKPMPMPNK